MTNEQLAALLQSVAGRFRDEVARLEAGLVSAPDIKFREFMNLFGYKQQSAVALEGLKEVLDDTYALIDTLRGGS